MNLDVHSLQATAAEVLALAVCDLFPSAKLLSGGVDGVGYYYDFAIEQKITSAFIPRIEELMRTCVKAQQPVVLTEMMRENAAGLFLHRGQSFKAELVRQHPVNIVPIVSMGQFQDFAFSDSFKELPVSVYLKILSIKPQLFYLDGVGELTVTRIYGVIFAEKKELKAFLKQIEAIKKRDHRLLGAEMEFFEVGQEVEEGNISWLSKGVKLRELFLSWWKKEHNRQGFTPLYTERIIESARLPKSERSKQALYPYFNVEDREYVLAPQVAYNHALAFKRGDYSAFDLPVKFCETIENFESLKVQKLNGLLNTRFFTRDYAHIFCADNQVVEELISSLQFFDKIINIVGANLRWVLISRGRKVAGTAAQWAKALQWVNKALNACGITADEESGDEHADMPLYGPQIQVHFSDALGRLWCGPNLGFNFYLPAQLSLCYQGSGGSKHPPVMLERTSFTTLERTLALLIENCKGLLPLEFAPEQVRLITLGPNNVPYGQEVLRQLLQRGCRATLDGRVLSLGAKIHGVEKAKVPYALILGNQEQSEKVVSIRSSGGKEERVRCTLEDFLASAMSKKALTAKLLNEE